MECLVKHLGDIEAQQFVAAIMREKFDYTQWQQQHFGSVNANDLNEAAARYEQEHPFELKKAANG